MAGRPWIKLHTRWLTSPAHADLSGETLGTGSILMLLVGDQGEDDGEGGRWLPIATDLRGTTAKDVIGTWLRRARVRLNTGRSHVQHLINARSFAIDDRGRLGMPNFAKWQEHPSAKRVRKHRAKGVTVTGEVEVEVEEEVDVDPRTIRTRQSNGSAEYARVQEWCVYGNAALGPWPDTETPAGVKVRRLVTTAKLADLMAPGRYTAQEVHEAVHGLAAMVKAGAFPAAQYTPSYVFSGYFATCLQALREWQAKEARRAEEEEQERMNAPAVYTDEQKKDLVF